RAHTAFTLYDELVRAARWVTGLPLEAALGVLHVVVRVTLLAGIFLITRAMGLSEGLALACAGVYALGGAVRGPSVLLVEYEPVPRAFALGPVALGIGFAAHRRYLAAGVAGAAAFLLHATTAAPFWAVYAVLLFVPDEPEEMKARLRGLMPLAAAALALKVAATLQAGVGEPQALLGRVDGAWEKLLRMRAAYVWVSEWPPVYFWQYGAMLAAASAAYWRLRHFIQPVLRFFVTGLVVLGVASLPLSYLLLEKLKWAMLPQIQPLRTILFLEMFTALLALVMAFELACKEQRPAAAGWWAAVALAVGVDPRLLFVLAPLAIAWLSSSPWRWAGVAAAGVIAWSQPFGMALWKESYRGELLVVLLLAAGMGTAASLLVRRRVAGAAAVATVVAAAFFLIPGKARFHWSGQPRNPELGAVSDWARRQTDANAVFLFADAGRGIDPGIFRARAARALYVDWKGGGQSNFFHEFSRIWWFRWQETIARPFQAEKLRRFRELGIDYVVLSPKNRLADRPAAFENGKYSVYSLR
ncbi:MAG: hypothetical protein HY238_07305, partial [Acidobacteria bacterium]|nr:hypothetical protein [Acidobacteriota bacterium]